jgi:hypothetical protein
MAMTVRASLVPGGLRGVEESGGFGVDLSADDENNPAVHGRGVRWPVSHRSHIEALAQGFQGGGDAVDARRVLDVG